MTVHSYAQEHMYIICRRVPLQFLPFAKPIISLITLNTNNEFSLLALFSCAAAHARETDSETDRQTDRQTARSFTKKSILLQSLPLHWTQLQNDRKKYLKTVTVWFSTTIYLCCHNNSSRDNPYCSELHIDTIGLYLQNENLYMFQIPLGLHRQWLFQMTRISVNLQYCNVCQNL